MNKTVTILVVCIFLGCKLVAQDTNAVSLPQFEKKTERYQKYLSGQKNTTFDSSLNQIFHQNTLSVLLAAASPVFIKNYGQGQLATTSFRGAGAEHTQVLWNGLNIQSPITGQTDFSLISNFLTDEVSLIYGGQSAINGSGAIGGTVTLQNNTAFNKPCALGYAYTLGSFGLNQHALKLGLGTSKLYFKAGALFNKAQNNYPFYNTTKQGSPLQNQTHAATKQLAALFEMGININKSQQLLFYYWLNSSHRDIPPSMASATNHGNQKDNSHRLLTKYQARVAGNAWLRLKLGLQTEQINYTDSVVEIASKTTGNSVVTEAEYQVELAKKLETCLGFNYTHSQGINTSYLNHVNRNTLAAFVSMLYKPYQKLAISVSVRQENADAQWLPFTSSLGATYRPHKQIKLMGQINKSYRLPTFNELYYPPGNLNVLPESGWMQEFGITAYFFKSTLWVGINAYNRLMQNWISWVPVSGTWVSENVKTVSTKGIEAEIGYNHFLFKLPVQCKFQASYLSSVNQATYTGNQQIVGKQLIYVPKFTHQTYATVWYNKFSLTGNLTYTGYRFTTADNSAYLDDYFLLNAFVGYKTKLKKLGLMFQLQGNNLLNTNYQVMATRAMPLQNFQFTTTIQF